MVKHPTLTAGKIWARDSATGTRRDLTLEEDHAFWAWAAVETLRLTGIRIEELLQLSHHSLIQYRLPSTGELVPLLQIVPSKSDAERLLLVSPELAEVLSAVIQRGSDPAGKLPLIAGFDKHERVFLPPAPLLFQRRHGTENTAISPDFIRSILIAALENTGLKDGVGAPLRYTPHDFRRIFITDAIMSGLPPHIAQAIAGHRDINVTLGYKATYPEESIQAHLAFLARRRALRPGEEYRVPTDDEWAAFLGHFEKRKVSTGTCGRAIGTPCIHEHVPLTEPVESSSVLLPRSTGSDSATSSCTVRARQSLRVRAWICCGYRVSSKRGGSRRFGCQSAARRSGILRYWRWPGSAGSRRPVIRCCPSDSSMNRTPKFLRSRNSCTICSPMMPVRRR